MLSADGKKKQTPIDRLGGLPENLICHILSFLPTKQSVQTCVLSKMWRSTWAQVPILDFDGDDYRGGSSMFLSHIIFSLLHKGVNKNTLYLKHRGTNCLKLEFETWVFTLIAHNVQNMHISLNYQFNLPQSIFSCKTLVDLRLTCCRVLIPIIVVQFPSLKKLRLEEIMYESESSLPNLLSGCPVLEELIMINIDISFVCCNISSPTLNRLDINSDFEKIGNKWCEVKLNTPALTYLRLHDFVSNDFSPGALTSLIEADVCFGAEWVGDTDMYCRSVLEFVGTVYNVKRLRLSTCSMEVVDDSAFSAFLTNIKFHNLTNLVLEADWRFISFFLENAENLQVLNIGMVDGNIKYWMEPSEDPVCVSWHLRKVTIREFGFTVGEFELVRYFLRNAKVMKCMEIYLEEQINEDVELDAIKRISKYRQGSEACELVFH